MAFHECRPELTGNDVLTWIEEQVVHHGYVPPTIRVHSDNAAAIARMRAGIENLPRLPERFARSPLTYAVRVHDLARGEDRRAVMAHQRGLVVVVADGAGGMPGGREAAELALRGCVRAVASLTSQAAIAERLEALDAACVADEMAGESTCVVVSIDEHGAVTGASVGDSEAWIIDGDRVVRLTERQRRKRLGSGRAEPAAFEATLRQGAVLVVGSDGLFDHVDAATIVATARDGDIEGRAEGLLQAALRPPIALADDLTVVVVSRSS